MDLDFVSVHKHAKKELGQYLAILTSHLVNNPYILHQPIDALLAFTLCKQTNQPGEGVGERVCTVNPISQHNV